MNSIPTNPSIRAAAAAPAAEPTQTQTTMLTAKQASESPLFAGSARLPTREMAARTVVMPPLTFSRTYELAAQTIEMRSPTITGIVETVQRQELTELDLVPFPKQSVLPANHAPADWLSNDMNPLYMGPSPSLRNSHFIGGGTDETTLSFLPDDVSPAALQNLSRENLKRFEQIRDSFTTETQTINIKEKDGSNQGRSVDVTVRKFNRPDPTTYLTQSAINKHLSMFRDQPCLFLTRSAFDNFCKNGIGRKDGQFLIPKDIGDRLEKQLRQKSTFAAAEAELGIPTGAWGGQEIIRVTVNDIPNLRMASGNEAGANKYWMPGGYLPNGLPEAVCDQIPLDNVTKVPFTPSD
jgi:hypothetical protein